jgi:hypothetical protein
MGVPIETALRWEQKHCYDIPEHDFPPKLRECVIWHFVKARTNDWGARLKDYWDPNQDDIRNNEKYRSYVQIGTDNGLSSKDLKFYNDDAELFPPFRPTGPEDQLRNTIEECKGMRRDFHGFMHLPSEIRDVIYGFALCKGRVIVPNSRRGMRAHAREPVEHYERNNGYYYRRYEGLEEEIFATSHSRHAQNPLGLIQGVSRAVHDEAARIYFGRNQFIFPASLFELPRYCNLRDDAFGVLSHEQRFHHDLRNRTNNAPLLRDVSYTFDMRDHVTDDYENFYWNFGIKESVDSRALSPGEALQALHDQKARLLDIDWVERIDSIKRMALDRLVLDFEECYCAIGCCRKVEWVLDRFLHEGPPPGTDDTEDDAFSSIDWLVRPPLVVEVMGIVNDDEKAMTLGKLRRLRGSKVRASTNS